MEKVRILYESEPGREGKCNAEVKGSPLDVVVGTAVIVSYVSEAIAKITDTDKLSVVQRIFESVRNEMLKEEE